VFGLNGFGSIHSAQELGASFFGVVTKPCNFAAMLKTSANSHYNANHSHLYQSMTSPSASAHESNLVIGLNQLDCHVTAEVVGLTVSSDEEDRGVALRLLEIGFLPGESVRVIAHGYPGHDPLAVRVGHTTFALRSHEAALVQVSVKSQQKGFTA
jgi:ferrous iron transport protein A